MYSNSVLVTFVLSPTATTELIEWSETQLISPTHVMENSLARMLGQIEAAYIH